MSVTVPCPGAEPPPPVLPPPDTTPPDTEITSAPKSKLKARRPTASAKFAFTSNDAGASFECSLDAAAFVACKSPQSYKLKRGRHTFAVRAVDAAGNRDSSPASVTVKVVRKKH